MDEIYNQIREYLGMREWPEISHKPEPICKCGHKHDAHECDFDEPELEFRCIWLDCNCKEFEER